MKHDILIDLIHQNAFELYGQPKWTFGKNTCNTYEVFTETIHLPGDASVPAQLFLELIEADEEMTLIYSQWFLKEAIRSAATLSEETHSHVTLSVNLLPVYANQETFVEQVLAAMQAVDFNPKKLQFEVSEAQNLTPRGVENLNLLHDEHGIGLYLANFGTGHANIDLLRAVHFDGIELDRSFAAAIQEDQMVRIIAAILNLANTLDLHVCAKGIETPEQFEFFSDLNVFKGQGYLIGKPMPMAELQEYISLYAVPAK